eukprot:Sspe_Gene.49457::Locus_26722_Transcript_1_1_Confidence_1.000_Length_3223::g.49457::m.49457
MSDEVCPGFLPGVIGEARERWVSGTIGLSIKADLSQLLQLDGPLLEERRAGQRDGTVVTAERQAVRNAVIAMGTTRPESSSDSEPVVPSCTFAPGDCAEWLSSGGLWVPCTVIEMTTPRHQLTEQDDAVEISVYGHRFSTPSSRLRLRNGVRAVPDPPPPPPSHLRPVKIPRVAIPRSPERTAIPSRGRWRPLFEKREREARRRKEQLDMAFQAELERQERNFIAAQREASERRSTLAAAKKVVARQRQLLVVLALALRSSFLRSKATQIRAIRTITQLFVPLWRFVHHRLIRGRKVDVDPKAYHPLSKHPLLGQWPNTELVGLAQRGREVVLCKKQVLYREGEWATALFVVVHGTIDLVGGRRRSRPGTFITRVEKGEVLCESSILNAEPVASSALCSSDKAVLWMITSSEFSAHVAQLPDELKDGVAQARMHHRLKLVQTQYPLTTSVLRSHPLFKSWPVASLANIINHAEPRVVGRGTVLFPEDRPTPGMYIVASGQGVLTRSSPYPGTEGGAMQDTEEKAEGVVVDLLAAPEYDSCSDDDEGAPPHRARFLPTSVIQLGMGRGEYQPPRGAVITGWLTVGGICGESLLFGRNSFETVTMTADSNLWFIPCGAVVAAGGSLTRDLRLAVAASSLNTVAQRAVRTLVSCPITAERVLQLDLFKGLDDQARESALQGANRLAREARLAYYPVGLAVYSGSNPPFVGVVTMGKLLVTQAAGDEGTPLATTTVGKGEAFFVSLTPSTHRFTAIATNEACVWIVPKDRLLWHMGSALERNEGTVNVKEAIDLFSSPCSVGGWALNLPTSPAASVRHSLYEVGDRPPSIMSDEAYEKEGHPSNDLLRADDLAMRPGGTRDWFRDRMGDEKGEQEHSAGKEKQGGKAKEKERPRLFVPSPPLTALAASARQRRPSMSTNTDISFFGDVDRREAKGAAQWVWEEQKLRRAMREAWITRGQFEYKRGEVIPETKRLLPPELYEKEWRVRRLEKFRLYTHQSILTSLLETRNANHSTPSPNLAEIAGEWERVRAVCE